MHRAVVLTTLALLLLAVAGVSAAQESGIFAAGSNSDGPPGSTTLERTSFGATVPEDPETSAPSGVSSKPEHGEDASEPTVVIEPTVEETEEPAVVAQVEEMRTPGSDNAGKSGNNGRGVGKPEHAGKPLNIGKPPGEPGHAGNGKSEEPRNEEEHGHGKGQQKITLCHKGKNTLAVGAPAQAAHLRHGDKLGAC
jgi:hypothetical protein